MEALAITDDGVVWAATAKRRTVELSAAARLIREVERWQVQGIPELVNSAIPSLQQAAEAFHSIVCEEKDKVMETRRQAEQRIADTAPQTTAEQPDASQLEAQREFHEDLSRRLWEVSQLQFEVSDLKAQEEKIAQRVAAAAGQLILVQEIADTAQYILKYYADREGHSAISSVLSKARGTQKILDAIINIGPSVTKKGMLVRKACLDGYATVREIRSILSEGWLAKFPELQNEFTLKLAMLEESLDRFRTCQALIGSDIQDTALPLVEQTLQTVREEVIPTESRWNDLMNDVERTAAAVEKDVKELVAKVFAGSPSLPPAHAQAVHLDPDEKYILKALAECFLEEKLTDEEYNVMVRSAGLDSFVVDGSGHNRANVELTVAQLGIVAGAGVEKVGTDIDQAISDAKIALVSVRQHADTTANAASQAVQDRFSSFGKILKDTFDDVANKLKEKK
ncbi:hypothetical protein ACTVZO_00465 [Streptomyces sp. IBSNAI002]|uniref:hypothetical protein n=1 Tax=Streptomyces sp. IBSNAI002 TaxID=3457500 RepID=UPI003FD45E76